MDEQLPHKLTLSERSQLTMTGVTEVVRFDDTTVVLRTCLGSLIVQGQQLQLKTLMPEGGNVTLEGEITAISYEAPRAAGWLGRLFQ